MSITHSATNALRQFWMAADLHSLQQRRERRLLLVCSLLMLIMGCAWGLFFTARQQWEIVLLDLALISGAVSVLFLNWRRQLRYAFLVIFSTIFVVICVIAMVYDVSTLQAPRATHLYLLPLSVAALLVFRHDGFWLRNGVALVGFVTFILLACLPGTPFPGHNLSDELRGFGMWVQAVASIGTLFALIHIMRSDSMIRSEMETRLLLALAQKEFTLHYQAQTDVQGKVFGAEALLRWVDPERGLVSPGEFIAIAEETGVIRQIGHWVLETACAQLQDWSADLHCAQLKLAVNISSMQIHQDDFVPQVLALIEKHQIAPGRLKMELTETMLVQNMHEIVEKMKALRQHGVNFSLDDFGTGYSSLNYLKRLPLSQLKIDQSFVRDVLTDPHDAAIARTILTLGHSLNLSVIAEGVETQGQFEFLRDNGCRQFQGYLFCRPLPIEQFQALVAAHQPEAEPNPGLSQALRYAAS